MVQWYPLTRAGTKRICNLEVSSRPGACAVRDVGSSDGIHSIKPSAPERDIRWEALAFSNGSVPPPSPPLEPRRNERSVTTGLHQ